MIIVSNACAGVSFGHSAKAKSPTPEPRKRLRRPNYANLAGVCQRPQKATLGFDGQ